MILHDQQLLPPWPLDSSELWQIEYAFSILNVARYTAWHHSPATQELELAAENLAETSQKLCQYSKRYPFLPRYLLPGYRKFSEQCTRLIECQRRFAEAHSYNQYEWTNTHLGRDENNATPSQWTLRAQLASQSIECYRNRPPLERDGYLIAFSPDAPSVTVTRLTSFQLKSMHHRSSTDDTWIPQLPEHAEFFCRRSYHEGHAPSHLSLYFSSPLFSSTLPPPPYSASNLPLYTASGC
ncbi:hypothetical protein GYMLUDRAFT_1016986 [Collybiopsis luxurians FD-317 M1]|uniref:Uncharacterized protein n=1 Tax=Collybiopsis luxurians FD-317 M1 TaxID=944289 RepID=A0A0D0AZN9_9AGAR|nr:hypothetical protein GYMLUDRAFT_1016986 [Collybiopsis luxurians FD-317 M1]